MCFERALKGYQEEYGHDHEMAKELEQILKKSTQNGTSWSYLLQFPTRFMLHILEEILHWSTIRGAI